MAEKKEPRDLTNAGALKHNGKTLKTTPAVAAGVADHEWSIEEIVALLVEREKSAASK